MKFTCERDSIASEIARASGIVGGAKYISMLSNVLLRLNGDKLTIRSTDLRISYEANVTVKGEKDGELAVPAAKLAGIVKSLPVGEVRFDKDAKETLKIEHDASRARFSLRGMGTQNFPPVFEPMDGEELEIPGEDLEFMVSQAYFAVTDDETRVFMSGVYFSREGEVLAMTSTDGKRLAHATRGTDSGNDFGVILPPKVLHEIRKAASEHDYTVLVNEREARFFAGREAWSSVAIDAAFPNYKRVIPGERDMPHRLVIDRAALVESVKRVALLVEAVSRRVYLDFSKNKVTIHSGNGGDIGTASQEVACEYDGPDITFCLNYEYLLDPLRELVSDYVAFKFDKNPKKALTLTTDPEQSVTQVLMPMHKD